MHDVRRVPLAATTSGTAGSPIATSRVSGSLALAHPVELPTQVLGRPWTVVITAVLMTFPALRIGARWHRWLQRRALQHRWFASVPSCFGSAARACRSSVARRARPASHRT